MKYIKKTINIKINCQIYVKIKILGYFQDHHLISQVVNFVKINKFCQQTYFEYINIMIIEKNA